MYYHKADGSARAPIESELLVKMCDFQSLTAVCSRFGVLMVYLCTFRPKSGNEVHPVFSAKEYMPWCTLSVQLRTCRNARIHHQKMQLFLFTFVMNGADQHATGIDAHHLARRQIHDGDAGLADELFGLIIGVNSA